MTTGADAGQDQKNAAPIRNPNSPTDQAHYFRPVRGDATGGLTNPSGCSTPPGILADIDTFSCDPVGLQPPNGVLGRGVIRCRRQCHCLSSIHCRAITCSSDLGGIKSGMIASGRIVVRFGCLSKRGTAGQQIEISGRPPQTIGRGARFGQMMRADCRNTSYQWKGVPSDQTRSHEGRARGCLSRSWQPQQLHSYDACPWWSVYGGVATDWKPASGICTI